MSTDYQILYIAHRKIHLQNYSRSRTLHSHCLLRELTLHIFFPDLSHWELRIILFLKFLISIAIKDIAGTKKTRTSFASIGAGSLFGCWTEAGTKAGADAEAGGTGEHCTRRVEESGPPREPNSRQTANTNEYWEEESLIVAGSNRATCLIEDKFIS